MPASTIVTKRRRSPSNRTGPQNKTISGSDASTAKPSTPPDTKDVAPLVRKFTTNSARDRKLIDGLTGIHVTAGLLLSSRDQYDGLVILTNSQKLSSNLVAVAKHHKWMYTALERLVSSSDYSQCFLAYGMIGYAILAHHGRVPVNDALLQQYGLHPIQIQKIFEENITQEQHAMHSDNNSTPQPNTGVESVSIP